MRIRELHELERHEWRVLGALRPVDGTTGMALRGALDVTGSGARIVRNRSGLYVIHEWSRMAAYSVAFDSPPDLPAPGSEVLEVVLRDPIGRYLSRRASIALPRDPADDPAQRKPRCAGRPVSQPGSRSAIGSEAVNRAFMARSARSKETCHARVPSRASALGSHFPQWHSRLEIVVYLQHLMQASFGPFKNHVYRRLLGEERECNAEGIPDEQFGRDR